MTLLPFERYTLHTTLRIQDVLIKLQESIQTREAHRDRRRRRKPYEGAIEIDAFSACPVKTGYRDSFLPVIKGTITQAMGGCSVVVTVRPNTGLLLFMALWLGAIGFAFIRTLWSTLGAVFFEALEAPLLPLAISGAMLAFGYGLLLSSFKAEAERSRRFFGNLLDENYREEEDEEALLNED